MKTIVSYVTAIAILYVIIIDFTSGESCKQGNTACIRDCLHRHISNITYDLDVIFADSRSDCENIIRSLPQEEMFSVVESGNSSVDHEDSGMESGYSGMDPEDPNICISLYTENTVSMIYLHAYRSSNVILSYTILLLLEDIMKHNMLHDNEQFCGIDELSVIITDEVGFRANCSDAVVETFSTFGVAAIPDAVDYDVVTQEFTYMWNESGILRQIKHTRCWFCEFGSMAVLVDPQDIIVDISSSEFEVKVLTVYHYDDDVNEAYVYYDFIELENGSFVVCENMTDFFEIIPPVAPPLHTSVPMFLIIPLVIVSLVSLTMTFITYCTFSELRNLPGKITMNFIVALFLALLTVIIDTLLPSSACVVAGPIFHYLWLTAFAWMNALSISITLTLTRTAPHKKSYGNKKLYSYMLYGWGAPIGIVAIPLTLHFCECTDVVFRYDAIMGVNGHQSCWLVSDYNIAEIVFFTIIISVLLGMNVILFCYTFCKLRSVTKDIKASIQSKKRSRVSDNIIFLKVTLLTGLPWVLQFPALLIPFLDYIYVILNALQGFFVFLVLVMNARVRRMWLRKCQKKSAQKKMKISTLSSQDKTKNTSI